MGRGHKKYTAEQMVDLFSSGATYEEIASQLGVSRQRVGQLSTKFRGAGEGRAFRKVISQANRLEVAEANWPETLQRIAAEARAHGLSVSAIATRKGSCTHKLVATLNIQGYVCKCHIAQGTAGGPRGISKYWHIKLGRGVGIDFRIIYTDTEEYLIFPGNLLGPGTCYIRTTEESAYPNRKFKGLKLRQYKDRWDLLKG